MALDPRDKPTRTFAVPAAWRARGFRWVSIGGQIVRWVNTDGETVEWISGDTVPVGSVAITGHAPNVQGPSVHSPYPASIGVYGWEPSAGGPIARATQTGSVSVQGRAPSVSVQLTWRVSWVAAIVPVGHPSKWMAPAQGSVSFQGLTPTAHRVFALFTPGKGAVAYAGLAPTAIRTTGIMLPAAGAVSVQGLAPEAITKTWRVSWLSASIPS